MASTRPPHSAQDQRTHLFDEPDNVRTLLRWFFGRRTNHDSGIRVREAPNNMLLAMGLGATACIGIGCFPQVLYPLLPFDTTYAPYTLSHLIMQTRLLFVAALAFIVLALSSIFYYV